MEQTLSGEMPRAGQTGEHNLGRQFRLVLLHAGFALLKHAPCLFQAFGTRDERLHLHLQFDALPPEEFASLHLGISGLLPVLVLPVTPLVLLLVTMGLLLVVHEGPFSFACFRCWRTAQKKAESSPHVFL